MGITNFDKVQANNFLDANGADIGAGELALTEGNIFIGDSNNLAAALDGSTDTQILVGNGTTMTSVAVSGDATLANTGALTIANGAVENAMLAASSVTNDKVGDSAGIAELTLPKMACVVYDFAVDGGTAGTIALTNSPTLPDNAVVWVEAYEVVTTLTSATDASTVTLTLPTDGDLFTAVAISAGANPWDQGIFNIGNGGALAGSSPKKCTAARVPQLTVAGGENITAGKIIFWLRYNVSE